MSPSRRRSNGAKPSPTASQDDTEPMTQAAPSSTTDDPPAGTSPQAAEAQTSSGHDDQAADTGADGAAATAGPAAQDETESMTEAGASAVAAPSRGESPAAAGAGSSEGSTEPPPGDVQSGHEEAEAGAEAADVGVAALDAEAAGRARGAKSAKSEGGTQDAAVGAEAGDVEVGRESPVGAEAQGTVGATDADADAEGEAGEGGESDEGPSADETLSVEMAAGRVQQPPQQRRSRQRGVRAALATLPVPEPGPSFWADLDASLADQQPLAIAARPAIRPISEPPPLSQPKLSDYLESTNVSGEGVRRSRDDSPGSDLARPPGRAPDFGLGGSSGRGRKALAVIVLIVLGLLVAGTIMGDGDDEPATSTDGGAGADDQATTTAPQADAAPTTPPVVPGLEPEARLTSSGIGPLQVGLTLGEINAAGVDTNVDQPTFDASGGACFDARPAGAADLTLRLHGPEPGVGVEDPAQGVLGAVTIRDVDGSLRVTTTEIGLGATEELVRDAHAGALSVSDNPSQPGGHVYVALSADDPDFGIAYATDGRQVTEISVGEVELIGVNQACA